jgi:hypothetical protein
VRERERDREREREGERERERESRKWMCAQLQEALDLELRYARYDEQ